MKRKLTYAIEALLVGAMLYWAVSMFAYNWRNPELSQMQMLRHIPEALTWQE